MKDSRTTEDKKLLHRDLCARLPYGLKYCSEEDGFVCELSIIIDGNTIHPSFENDTAYIDNIKPYLFPLSSMTDEQKFRLLDIRNDKRCSISDEIDFYLENHLDYRCLINRGLTMDATGLNIYQDKESMKEGVVSFEIAKLLKEKSFKEYCLAYYDEDGSFIKNPYPFKEDINIVYNFCYAIHNDTEHSFDAPFIHQVLRWLREEKGISIEPWVSNDGWNYNIDIGRHWYEYWLNYEEVYTTSRRGGSYEAYEDAVTSAILYVLCNEI